MNAATAPSNEDQIWNVPNQISMARLLLSILVFILIPTGFYWAAFIVFIVAASTDWVDGWWARRYNQVTRLGRMLDPFCDKILICGVFILLAEAMYHFPWYAKITGWMAVVVIARELLVTGMRGLIEQSGGDFSAKMPGKVKMWFQSIAAGAGLVALAFSTDGSLTGVPAWVAVVVGLFAWLAVLSTVYSGAIYAKMAGQLLGLSKTAAS